MMYARRFRAYLILLAALILVSPFIVTAADKAKVAAEEVVPSQQEMLKSMEPFAKAAKATGTKELRISFQAGADVQFTNEFKDEWEKTTGIKIEVENIPPESMHERLLLALSGDYEFDAVDNNPTFIGEWAESGYIENLDSYYEKYKNLLNLSDFIEGAQVGFNKYKGNWYGIPYDGDVLIWYYRKDLWENPKHKADFKAKYKYDLKVPDTWKEALDMAEFFDGREPGLKGFGTVATRWWGSIDFWGSVYWAMIQKDVQSGLVNDNNQIELDRDAFIKGNDLYMKLFSHAPEGVLNWGFSESKEALAGGQVAQSIQWATTMFIDPRQARYWDKLGFAVLPGWKMADGSIKRKASLAVGKGFLIPTNSKNKDAAFLYCQWMATKEAQIWCTNTATGIDPNRSSVFADPRVKKVWGAILAPTEASLAIGVPDIKVPAAAKYYEALLNELHESWAGNQTSAQAYDKVMKAWKRIQQGK
jgi:multiple sugar transport system substrate-binding protein